MGPDEASLDDLGERLQRGDEAAFEEFSRVYPRRSYWYFFRSGASPVDAEQLAEDLVHEILFTKLSRYRSGIGGGFPAWVKTLAQHAASDWQKRRKPLFDSFKEEAVKAQEQEYDGEEGGEERLKISRAVRAALATLGEDDADILDMRDVRNMTFAEIGEILGIAEGTARVRHHRAKLRIREILLANPRLLRSLHRRKSG